MKDVTKDVGDRYMKGFTAMTYKRDMVRLLAALMATGCLLSGCGESEEGADAGVDAAAVEGEACVVGQTRCRGNTVQVCDASGWKDATDCPSLGKSCFVIDDGAMCVTDPGFEPDAAIDAGLDGGMPAEGGVGPEQDGGGGEIDLENLFPVQECPENHAWDRVEGECVLCSINCTGNGVEGLYEALTIDGKCICQTKRGYYWPESGLMAIKCDKDQDGWITIEAYSSITSQDEAYSANARCSLRTIDRFVLESEGSKLGTGLQVMLSDLNILHRGLPLESLALYEPEIRDIDERMAEDNRVKPYGTQSFSAKELNSLTKACVDSIADYNANNVPDISEWDRYDQQVNLWELFPEFRIYAMFGYFVELHWGWYEEPADDNPHGAYHIREKSRLDKTEQHGVPINYYGESGYWRRCMRKTDSAFVDSPVAIGMDFARYNNDTAAFSSGLGTENLLRNPAAESQGSKAWKVEAGALDQLQAGECEGGTSPHQGSRYFVAGGICANQYAFGKIVQSVDVSDHKRAIDEGSVEAFFGGYLSNWRGDDEPGIQLVYRDEDGGALGNSERLSSTSSAWTFVAATSPIPKYTRSIDFVMTGQRNSGTANNSYLDDLFLQVITPTSNQLANPGAERGIESWTQDIGPLQALDKDGECNGTTSRNGHYYFSVGGMGSGSGCASERVDLGRAYQDIELDVHTDVVDSGELLAYFGGWLLGEGDDMPQIELYFRQGSKKIGASQTLEPKGDQWERVQGMVRIPPGTETIRFVLLGERGSSDADNNSFFDDLFLRLATGAWMHHHSQFKCVQVVSENKDPEYSPHKVTFSQIETEATSPADLREYQLNKCGKVDDIPPVNAPNPSDTNIECERENNPSAGDVGFAIVNYQRYPVADNESYIRGCINECVDLVPECDREGGVATAECEPRPNDFGSTVCDCIGAWIKDDFDVCSICPGSSNDSESDTASQHWFLDGDICETCQGNWDVDADCSLCLGNWDFDDDCNSCRNHWVNEVDDNGISNNCGTCPGNWDPNQDCNECKGLFNKTYNCERCTNDNFDPAANCLTCRQNHDCQQCAPDEPCEETCLGAFTLESHCTACVEGYDVATQCLACKPNRDPQANCLKCLGNYDIATDCQQCLPNFDPATQCYNCLAGFEKSGDSCIMGNLLTNPGAEEGDDESWGTTGDMYALFQGHCDEDLVLEGIAPYEGDRFFHVGAGYCGTGISETWKNACQTVEVFDHAEDIDRLLINPSSGQPDPSLRNASANYKGRTYWFDDDHPGIQLAFLRADDSVLERWPTDGCTTCYTPVHTSDSDSTQALRALGMCPPAGQGDCHGWFGFSGSVTVPRFTRKIAMCLVNDIEELDTQSDVFFDALSLRLAFSE